MPGTACHFTILNQLRAELPNHTGLADVRNAIEAHPEWAHLGAVGPALADFMPGTRGTNPYVDIWSEVFSLIGDGMRVDKGALTIVREVKAFLEAADPILAAEDEAALETLDLDTVKNVGDDLQAVFDQIQPVALSIGANILANMRPAVNVGKGNPVPPSQFWRLREYLFWKRPGTFTKTLVQKMTGSGDARFEAYAYGYLMSYAANVTGSPFVNSSIGAPYRNHWWRFRWVNNYIDAWVFGKYGANASMGGPTGDDPAPPYGDWPSLCDANLHDAIALASHDEADLMIKVFKGETLSSSSSAPLPAQFTQLWIDAFDEAYGSPPAPIRDIVTAQNLNDAYLLTWLTLWFQTGSDSLGCNPAPPLSPPTDCGAEPPWVSPAVSGSGTSVSVPTPETPEIENDPDVAQIITGILLALLGAGAIFAGNLAAGGGLLALGIQQIIDGAIEPDWDLLRCYSHWYKWYLHNALKALHEILSVTAFRHPAAAELASPTTMSAFFPGFVDPYDSGRTVTRSRRLIKALGVEGSYPAPAWTGGFDWMNRPTGLEQPSTTAYLTQAYPDFFVDSTANPLSGGEVRLGGVWPLRIDASGTEVQFGNAVENAIDLYSHLGDDLPNWNLDADRGLAYHAWQFLADIYSDPIGIEPEI